MKEFASFDDLDAAAKRRLPHLLYEFVSGGADGEVTLRDNRAAFDRVRFEPRTGTIVGRRDLTTEIFGETYSMPLLLAPCGQVRLVHPPAGEVAAAAAAGNMGTTAMLSSMAGSSIEDVAKAATVPPWFQIYPYGGTASTEDALRRARESGCRVLVATMDTPMTGRRERDIRNGVNAFLEGKPSAVIRAAPQVLRHPFWFASFLRAGRPMMFPNLVVDGETLRVGRATKAVSEHWMTWDTVEWMRTAWTGPFVLKGILSPDDARRAVDYGADGVYVSNHGGRQLDTSPATLDVLPAIVDAVGGRAAVFVDGGIRRGSDVVKAVCLGATAAVIGRPYIYGLAVDGVRGVETVLEYFRREIDRTLALIGAQSCAELGPRFLFESTRAQEEDS